MTTARRLRSVPYNWDMVHNFAAFEANIDARMEVRIGDLRDTLDAYVAEHAKAHESFQVTCARSMEPIQDLLNRRHDNRVAWDARVGPPRRALIWATNHWPVSVGIGALIFAAWTLFVAAVWK